MSLPTSMRWSEMQDKLNRGATLMKELGQYKYSPLTQQEILDKIPEVLWRLIWHRRSKT